MIKGSKIESIEVVLQMTVKEAKLLREMIRNRSEEETEDEIALRSGIFQAIASLGII